MYKNKILNKKKIYNFQNNKNVRIPPHSIEAEQSVLGGLILDNTRWDEVLVLISYCDFFKYQHRQIFIEMGFLIESNKPIDLITLSESLEQKNSLSSIGGFAYLAELSKNTPSSANILAYANIVREKSIIREMISVSSDIVESCYYSNGRNSNELLDLAESRIFKIAENRTSKNIGPQNITCIIENTISHIEYFCKKSFSGITGVSSGYLDLDKKTAGLQKSDLIIIAARPSMGKTTFAINLCENVSITENKPVLIFSLEMSTEQIMMRIISSLSKVELTKIRTGQLNDNDWKKISNSMNSLLNKRNIYIDDSSGLTPIEVRARSRRIFREHDGLSLILIDYLQLMRVPSMYGNRTLEIAEISRSLKALAKELQVPVIAISQLNRSLEQRNNKRPINSDLRESGSIEQDADLIMFIYRDEIYYHNTNYKNVAEIIIGKHRNGPVGTIKLFFNGKYSRFDNYTDSFYFK